MRANASLTREAFIEADLAQIFQNDDAASIALLWLLIHFTSFGTSDAPPHDCALERWREEGAREGAAARKRLAGQVQQALAILGTGFLEANPKLAQKVQSGDYDRLEFKNDLLRLVYRLLVLMVAEDRNLLHPPSAMPEARALYAPGYSLTPLRAQSVRRATWDRHHDRYEGLKIVFRALARGEPRLGLPALGGLFAHDFLPTLEAARLKNRALMEALDRLSSLDEGTGLVPVNWSAMETEERGSVYESLLELEPQLAEGGRRLTFATKGAETRGNQRKTTGSYYTLTASLRRSLTLRLTRCSRTRLPKTTPNARFSTSRSWTLLAGRAISSSPRCAVWPTGSRGYAQAAFPQKPIAAMPCAMWRKARSTGWVLTPLR